LRLLLLPPLVDLAPSSVTFRTPLSSENCWKPFFTQHHTTTSNLASS
jgi:hypothetical protein